MNSTEPRLHTALDAAINQIRITAGTVATRACESLGAAASAATGSSERDTLLAAQQDLRRSIAAFQSVFHEVLHDKVKQELVPRVDTRRRPAPTNWQALSLVDDREVEERMSFERIGQMISHACEWQLRDLAAYMGSLTGSGRADEDKNPLRADIVGTALYRAIEAVSENPDSRRILVRDLGSAMAQAMPDCYAEILRGLQQRGIQPVELTVRSLEGPGHQLPGLNSAYASLPLSERNALGGGQTDFGAALGTGTDVSTATMPSSGPGSRSGHARSSHGGTGHPPSVYAHQDTAHADGRSSARARITSQADVQLMTLLRRLTAVASISGEFNPAPNDGGYPASAGRGSGYPTRAGDAAGSTPHAGSVRGGVSDFIRSGSPAGGGSFARAGAGTGQYHGDALTGLMAVNLIRAHREELMQASTGKLDHMVIDVVGSLFDQILSDSRVPPQMARQIARLQLPVLRVALNDQTFFSTRRHPVRRFINRIASLACAFEDFSEGPGKQFLTRVSELVQEIVDGDFDQIELYAAKLAALEGFIADQAEGGVEQTGAVATLATKESELRVQQRYMQQLQAALAPIALPDYLADFIPQVWSQALVLSARRDGHDSDLAKRFRRVGRDLVMSIQPKGSPMYRKKFLMQLPPLMKDLNEGMQLIGWPEAAQREFFSKLLPAHAESLKGQPLSELDHNLMAKQLETVFNMPIPGIDAVSIADPLPEVEESVLEHRFTPEEAKQVGLLPESAVNWNGSVDIDLAVPDDPADSTVGAPSIGDSNPALDPTSTESGELGPPVQGAQLMDHVKVGFAYQMHLKDQWQKVRLAHVSSGRSFFVFTRGVRHQETISMTSRMLARMCETGRMRAVESAYLMERATHRARKQLAQLKVNTRH